MTLTEALDYFKKLESQASNKSEIKVYEKFIHTLSGLEKIDLNDADIQSIEKALDALDLTSTSASKKYFNKALNQFQKYLRDTFSIITKGYYTNLGIGLGSSFGILFGVVFLSGYERSLGISMGISFGMLFGLIIGRKLDSQAMANNKVVY